ncbi:MAG: hypothetical protein ABI140_03330 [Jatrophihabitantaceae bacterium]
MVSIDKAIKRLATVSAAALALAAGVLVASQPAAAVGEHNPVGNLDSAAQTSIKYDDGQVHVIGWAGDPDLGPTSGLKIVLYVDGRSNGVGNTHLARPDVQRAYPHYGPNTGFDVIARTAPGTHSVCAWAINRGSGANTRLGCQNFLVMTPTQVVGHIDSIAVTGSGATQQVTFRGWALDPYDTSGKPLSASVYQPSYTNDWVPYGQADFTTSIARPDVARVYPGRNPNSGFVVQFTASQLAYYVSGKPVSVAIVYNLLPPGPNVIYTSPNAVTFP